MRWQPIKTAPKTSVKNYVAKQILVWVPDPDDDIHGGSCYVAWWEPGPLYKCWVWCGAYLDLWTIKPTHWMPLPEPPA